MGQAACPVSCESARACLRARYGACATGAGEGTEEDCRRGVVSCSLVAHRPQEPRMLLQLRAVAAAAFLVQLRVASTFALLCYLAACTSRDGSWSGAHRRGGVYAGPSRYYPS